MSVGIVVIVCVVRSVFRWLVEGGVEGAQVLHAFQTCLYLFTNKRNKIIEVAGICEFKVNHLNLELCFKSLNGFPKSLSAK